jgi:hypothetical protein
MPFINVEIEEEVLKKLRLTCALNDWTQREAVEAAIRLQFLTTSGQLGEAVEFDDAS